MLYNFLLKSAQYELNLKQNKKFWVISTVLLFLQVYNEITTGITFADFQLWLPLFHVFFIANE